MIKNDNTPIRYVLQHVEKTKHFNLGNCQTADDERFTCKSDGKFTGNYYSYKCDVEKMLVIITHDLWNTNAMKYQNSS